MAGGDAPRVPLGFKFMREFQEQRKFKKLLFSKISIFLLFVVLVIVSIPVRKIYQKSRMAIERNEKVQDDLQELRDRKEKLEEEVVRLQTEIGKEEEIRKKFNVSKPGENTVVVVDRKEDASSEDQNKKGFFQKLMFWRD
jgi:cell division protein FtsB